MFKYSRAVTQYTEMLLATEMEPEEENAAVAQENVEKILGVKSKGIPAKRALWFEYDKLPMPVTARWEPEDVLKLVFPPHAQSAQHEIAIKLVRFLSEREEASGEMVADWSKQNNVANSTLRNLVIPKLIRVGILARHRIGSTGQEHKDKRREMVLSLSTKFGEALKHIGSEWNSVVETWRHKRKQEQKI
jgi:hypothetical protein